MQPVGILKKTHGVLAFSASVIALALALGFGFGLGFGVGAGAAGASDFGVGGGGMAFDSGLAFAAEDAFPFPGCASAAAPLALEGVAPCNDFMTDRALLSSLS